MTGATMFSGILAPELAIPYVDWKWCAEIEPFPCEVIKQRRPELVNLGDVTAEDFIERAKTFGPLDVLVAGSACQSFSLAGLRKSLGDKRGILTLRLVEVVHAIKPKVLLFENVPGILSTPDNAFGCFLAGLVGFDEALIPERFSARSKRWRISRKPIHKRLIAGQWTVLKWGKEKRIPKWTRAGVVSGPNGTATWRVLCAQWFGVAQRRERVFVVFCLGDSTASSQILLESEGGGRNPPSREKARQGFTEGVAASLGAGCFQNTGHADWQDDNCATTIRSASGGNS